jgi:hypothetical protein
MKAYGGSGCIDPHFIDLGLERGECQLHALTVLPAGKEPQVPIG